MDVKKDYLENEDIELSEPLSTTSQPKNSNHQKCQWWTKLGPTLKAFLILFFSVNVLILISFASCGIGRHFEMCPLPYYR